MLYTCLTHKCRSLKGKNDPNHPKFYHTQTSVRTSADKESMRQSFQLVIQSPQVLVGNQRVATAFLLHQIPSGGGLGTRKYFHVYFKFRGGIQMKDATHGAVGKLYPCVSHSQPEETKAFSAYSKSPLCCVQK